MTASNVPEGSPRAGSAQRCRPPRRRSDPPRLHSLRSLIRDCNARTRSVASAPRAPPALRAAARSSASAPVVHARRWRRASRSVLRFGGLVSTKPTTEQWPDVAFTSSYPPLPTTDRQNHGPPTGVVCWGAASPAPVSSPVSRTETAIEDSRGCARGDPRPYRPGSGAECGGAVMHAAPGRRFRVPWERGVAQGGRIGACSSLGSCCS